MAVLTAIQLWVADKRRSQAANDLRKHYQDGACAILLMFTSQILIYALERLTTVLLGGFSAAILGMLILAILITLLNFFVSFSSKRDAVDKFYQEFLRGPTDLLNRHMSIGFTVPFLMIFKQEHPVSAEEIGLITACFLVTGILMPFLVYTTVYGSCRLVQLFRGSLHKFTPQRVEVEKPRADSIATLPPIQQPNGVFANSLAPAVISTRASCRLSENSTLIGNRGTDDSTDTDAEIQQASHRRRKFDDKGPRADESHRVRWTVGLMDFVSHNVALVVCAVCVPIMAIVEHHTSTTVLLDTAMLFTTWLGMQSLHRAVKHASSLLGHKRLRTTLAAALNPVLLTSLLLIAYVQAKTAGQHAELSQVLQEFQSTLTLAKYIHNRTSSWSPPANGTSAAGDGGSRPCMGAGDVAMSILESGLVCWGLKLFECRQQLLSGAGLLTLAASTIFAAAAATAGPLLAHAMGLTKASSIAFLARSVTLALGSPAVERLGGDVGANAAMVVLSGVVFQMGMGLGAGGLMQGCMRSLSGSGSRPRKRPGVDEETGSDGDGGVGGCKDKDKDKGKDKAVLSSLTPLSRLSLALGECYSPSQQPRTLPPTGRQELLGRHMETGPSLAGRSVGNGQRDGNAEGGCRSFLDDNDKHRGADEDGSNGSDQDDARVVAAGVTVGINAAAMGTSYLYEHGSRAAPYSALAMTIFGVMTVVFTSIQPLMSWLIGPL